MRTTPLLLLLLTACPKRNAGVEGQLDALLTEADAAWERRGTLGFDPTDDALQRAFGLSPDAPAVLWRLTRLRVAEAQTQDDPERRVAALGMARSLGWSCVRADAGVVALEAELGVAEAFERMPVERQPCVAWAAYAWSRWLVAFDAEAGSLDLETLDAVSRAGLTYDDPDVRLRLAWADSIAQAGRPDWADRDPVFAREMFDRVIEEAPEELEAQIDRFVLLDWGTPTEADAKAKLSTQRADTPEEQASLARALGDPSVRRSEPAN